MEELIFWLQHIDKFNGLNIWPKPSVYSDASSTDYGGYCMEHGDQVAVGQWSPEEAHQSSTWREPSIATSARSFWSKAKKL